MHVIRACFSTARQRALQPVQFEYIQIILHKASDAKHYC